MVRVKNTNRLLKRRKSQTDDSLITDHTQSSKSVSTTENREGKGIVCDTDGQDGINAKRRHQNVDNSGDIHGGNVIDENEQNGVKKTERPNDNDRHKVHYSKAEIAEMKKEFSRIQFEPVLIFKKWLPDVPFFESITLTLETVGRVCADKFADDLLVSFKMMDFVVENWSSELAHQTYIYSTFFFQRMNEGLEELCFSSPHRENRKQNEGTLMGQMPIRWTRSFDVFEKMYLVIPICYFKHWTLAIVINPGGAIVSRTIPEDPCWILFFDSSGNVSHKIENHVVFCLKMYLKTLFEQTRASGMKFDKKSTERFEDSRVKSVEIIGHPVQTNFTDCAFYVLQNFEDFFTGINGPISKQDVKSGTLNWRRRFPQCNQMAQLMRHKTYNLVRREADAQGRSRLDIFEKYCLAINKAVPTKADRKGRHHSAVGRQKPRHAEYHTRWFSIHPTSANTSDISPFFRNPRELTSIPALQKVRKIRSPENGFPAPYT